MYQFMPLFTGGVAVLLYGLFLVLRVGRRPKDLPPGPPTVPVLGNIHLMPVEDAHLQFQKWAEEYGPIYSLILGTKTYIVLSTPKAVKDVLDKRSAIYSSRPDMYLGHEIVSGARRFVTMKYGPVWRGIHKMMHNTLNIEAAVAYIPYQDLENKDMMVAFLDDPDHFLMHVRRYTSSLTTQMVFGYRTTFKSDPRLLEFFENFEEWARIIRAGSAALMDLYPIFRMLPGLLNSGKRNAEKLAVKEADAYMRNWMTTKRKILDGTALPCFSYNVFKAQEAEGFSDLQAAYTTGSLLEGGSDTTSGLMVGFIQAVMMFPDVQEAAQAQIDQVVGLDRLPTLDDWDNLPYIRACVKESIRWMPTAILGAPHSNIQEDFYEGYRIPVGSTIITNVWAMNMDPKRNPDPRVFDPSRFENDLQTEHESATNKDPEQRQNWIFGAGRRLCQGMHIAERSLFLAYARMLWGFNFGRGLDADGIPIPIDIDKLVGGITVQPADFKVNITPRSREKENILRNAWKNCVDDHLDSETKQWVAVPPGMRFDTSVKKDQEL